MLLQSKLSCTNAVYVDVNPLPNIPIIFMTIMTMMTCIYLFAMQFASLAEVEIRATGQRGTLTHQDEDNWTTEIDDDNISPETHFLTRLWNGDIEVDFCREMLETRVLVPLVEKMTDEGRAMKQEPLSTTDVKLESMCSKHIFGSTLGCSKITPPPGRGAGSILLHPRVLVFEIELIYLHQLQNGFFWREGGGGGKTLQILSKTSGYNLCHHSLNPES